MGLAHASWLHGHGMEIEAPNSIARLWRAGFYCRVEGEPRTDNWFHFAIPTPVIVREQRLSIGSVMLRYRAAGGALVHAVHVYDGEDRVAHHDGRSDNPEDWVFARFEVPGTPEVRWGVGISIGVRYPGADGRLEFAAAGCDFIGRTSVVVERP